MRIVLFIFISIFISQSIFALTLGQRRNKIISIIDEELSEIQRLSNQTGNRNPEYLFRMAELNFEKGRLWRDAENEEFLALSEQKRRLVNKKKYFVKSNRYYNNAVVLCKKIVKKFPKSKNISDVYYILGHDAKEKKKLKSAQKYLKIAIKKARRNKKTKVKAQIALAETYYNKKYYKKAYPLYEKALSQSDDKWWTKDSFNLAWSYYRSRKYANAINKMKEVYQKSSNGKYVDMRDQVRRDIGFFYATSGRINEGISFYEKLGVDFSKELLKIASQLKSDGKFSDAQKILGYAEKYIKNDSDKADVYIEQLALFERYSRYREHLGATQKLFNLFKNKLLDSNQTKTLLYQVKRMGAVLQKKVASKTYQARPKLRKIAAKRAKKYFEITANLEPQKLYEYTYLQAETDFANKAYASALLNYELSFDYSKKQNKSKFMKRSVDGMLFCLSKREVSKAIKEKYYVSAYEKLLSIEPKSKRSYKTYEKLFNAYLQDKQYVKAENVLIRLKQVYPKSFGKQEAMIAYLMDESRKKKDYVKIREWIQKIDAGKYRVSSKYKKKLRELLTTIQIENVQKSLNRGQKKNALIGYHKILKDPDSTKKSKINAKYNLAALYYELGAENESYAWSMRAVDEMSPNDVRNFSDSFLAISNFLFMKMYFDKSANLSEKVLNKMCKLKSRRKKIAFKNAAFIRLADNELSKTVQLVNVAKKCRVSSKYISDVEFEILKELEKQKKWEKYEDFAEKMSLSKSRWPRLIVAFDNLEKVHRNFGNLKKAQNFKSKRNRLYQYSKSKKVDIPVEALDTIAFEKLDGLRLGYKSIENIKLSFPQKVFNQAVVRKLKILEEQDKQYANIEEIGSGKAILEAAVILADSYDLVGNDLKNFTPNISLPKDQKNEFMKGFSRAMRDNYTPILMNAGKIRRQAVETMNKYDILSDANFELVQGKVRAIRYWSPYYGVTMDKGGKR